MILKTYFIFLPSQELINAAQGVGEKELLESSVWATQENDRTGLEHSQSDIESAFWEEFKAKLINENESVEQSKFRGKCLSLGFSNCWSVVKTTSGGDAKELIESGNEAREFLKGFSSQ